MFFTNRIEIEQKKKKKAVTWQSSRLNAELSDEGTKSEEKQTRILKALIEICVNARKQPIGQEEISNEFEK